MAVRASVEIILRRARDGMVAVSEVAAVVHECNVHYAAAAHRMVMAMAEKLEVGSAARLELERAAWALLRLQETGTDAFKQERRRR